MWIRENDLVLVAPWDFKSDRADIIWRYTAANAEKLEQEEETGGMTISFLIIVVTFRGSDWRKLCLVLLGFPKINITSE